MEHMEQQLEHIFTIDGKGRPAKAKELLKLIEELGIEAVMEGIKKISERKNF